MSGVTYRAATAADAEGGARLHAGSWRRNYRGAYPGALLNGDLFANRLAVWTERLTWPKPTQFTVVAERDCAVVGFAHTVLGEDPAWGALLDNLHVTDELRGQGIGTQLMARTAEALLERNASTGLYLWVLEQNTAGQAFYDARGSRAVGREVRVPPGGGRSSCASTHGPIPPTFFPASDRSLAVYPWLHGPPISAEYHVASVAHPGNEGG